MSQSWARNYSILFLLTVLLVTGCRPKDTGPDIQSVVATSRVGTLQARAIGTIVSATNAALAAHPPHNKLLTQPPALPPSASLTASPIHSPNGCPNSAPGNILYDGSKDGYCFLYPDNFFVKKPGPGVVEFLGPALDQSLEPVRAYINFTQKERVKGRTLDEISASLWRESRNPFKVANIQLGGRDALVADNLVIGEKEIKTRQVFFIQQDWIYLITFSPVESSTPYAKALPDIQNFWNLAIPSFRFTP